MFASPSPRHADDDVSLAATIKLDTDYDLEVHELTGTDQYWARIVDRQTGRSVGDRLLASGTSRDMVVAELKLDALATIRPGP